MLDDEVHQLFKNKYDWVSELEWRELFKHMKRHEITDPIPVNNMAMAPRNSSETEAWFKTQARLGGTFGRWATPTWPRPSARR